MNFAGPEVLKLSFHVFIVIVGSPDPGRCGEYVADRRQRRAEPGG